MKKKYTIGLDYGSLSGRGVLADTSDGSILAEAVMEYPHGIMDSHLPDGTSLKGQWCLQHPQDYMDVLDYVIPQLMERSGIDPGDVVGLGVDFTTSTVIPLDSDFKPLSSHEKYAGRPHAWTKLWKHHGAGEQARQLTSLCREQKLPYLDWYGGSISAECLMSKVLQVFCEDREVFEAADCFMEAADYMTSLLAGKPVFSGSIAAAKAMWSRRNGYPQETFFQGIDDSLKDLPQRKLMGHFPGCKVGYPGESVGGLCPDMARRLGLPEGIAISAPQMDGYAAMPGVGIMETGVMMMIIGTSTGIMVLSEEEKNVEGVMACLPDTFYPGVWGYASGQASVGDGFQWFIDNCVPEHYVREAERQEKNMHQYLTELASVLKPGQTGLVALDWLNGNKSCLGNSQLSGLILGLNLQTKPEHIYRALLEATAFGARKIQEAYEQAGILIREVTACGGIAGKNPLLMQIYADVLGKPIKASLCTQAPALGSAIYAAAAAGKEAGCVDIFDAVEKMGNRQYCMYFPKKENQRLYEALYREYRLLHDYFGRGQNRVMERLTQARKRE